MNNFIQTKKETLSPGWTERNQKIASLISQNSKILDLGCGEKDLLNYVSPSKYIGIDYQSNSADIRLNFNNSFVLPKDEWDYIVCSGLIEYISDIHLFFESIKNNSRLYVFTFWTKNESIREKNGLLGVSINEFKEILNKNYSIIEATSWKSHEIYVCQDKI